MLPFTAKPPYINTIHHTDQVKFPGNRELERRIKNIVRWNAMAMVVRANKYYDGVGGHISTFASSATLYEIAQNHFFHARSGDHTGDMVYFQGHASPGMYLARVSGRPFDGRTSDQFPSRTACRELVFRAIRIRG